MTGYVHPDRLSWYAAHGAPVRWREVKRVRRAKRRAMCAIVRRSRRPRPGLSFWGVDRSMAGMTADRFREWAIKTTPELLAEFDAACKKALDAHSQRWPALREISIGYDRI